MSNRFLLSDSEPGLSLIRHRKSDEKKNQTFLGKSRGVGKAGNPVLRLGTMTIQLA